MKSLSELKIYLLEELAGKLFSNKFYGFVNIWNIIVEVSHSLEAFFFFHLFCHLIDTCSEDFKFNLLKRCCLMDDTFFTPV